MTSFTYGTLPPTRLLNDELDKIGPYYRFRLSKSDLAIFSKVTGYIDEGLEAVFFTQKGNEIYVETGSMIILIQRLINEGSDVALDFCSSILQTLNIEWV